MSSGATRRKPDVFGSRTKPGTVIAERYRVVDLLGAGGMGQVLLVEHLELSKRFALKLIRPDRWDDTLEARFRREARALARVASPRVAEVTDFGVDPEHGPYFVMEHIEGRTLGELLEEEAPLDPPRALEIAIGIAEALRDVHAAGIVHRDVKPGNVAITAGPVEVRLMDFGLAASFEQGAESRITESRAVVGSMPYMAPEQFGGGPPSPQMDLWALGIVLYEMLHGRLPFEAQSTPALIHQILTNEVPLTPRVGPALAPVFAGLLAKEPSERVASAAEAIELLETAALAPRDQWESSPSAETMPAIRVDTHRGPPAPAPEPPSGSRAWWPLAAGGALLVVGVAALSWQLGRTSAGEGRPLAHEEEAQEQVAGAPRALAAAELEPVEADLGAPVAIEPTPRPEADATRAAPPSEPSRRAEPIAARRARRGRPRAAARPAAAEGEGAPAPREQPSADGAEPGSEPWTGGIIETP